MRYAPILGPIQKNQHEYTLDAVDKKLLQAFSADPRQSIASVAKAARVSRDVATYRMQRFEERGIICGTRLVVAVKKLGFDAYHIFLKLSNVEESIEQMILKNIIARPYVRSFIKFFGQYDYEIAIIAKSVEDFDEKLSEIIEFTGKYVQSYDVFIISKYFVSRPMPLSFATHTITEQKYTPAKKLDDLDLKIVQTLANDARQPLTAVAQKLNTTVDTVLYRYKKLQEWLVKGTTPVINYHSLGYTIHAVLLDVAQFDSAQEQKCMEFVRQSTHVIWAVKTIGRANVLIYFCTKTEQEFQDAITQLRAQFPQAIRRHDSLSAVSQLKYTITPDCIFQSQN
ncbi:MAG TPA: Lrp/AsnC family transcriptional regulator [Acidobacteriota bacterium]|nr:Lrp/AsnC family transcriptional regulator [Acidobacteriota bacterium]